MDEDRYYNLGSHDKLFNQIDELTDALASRDAEIESLRQQLSASQKREVTLRKLIGEIYCSDDSSAEVTRKIEDVLSAMGNSYSKESTQGFEDWHSSHAKYMEPADIIHWCRDAYNAGVTSKCDVQLAAAQAKIDELMLEYCPEEMTNGQIAEYEKHQRPAWRNFSLELKKEQK